MKTIEVCALLLALACAGCGYKEVSVKTFDMDGDGQMDKSYFVENKVITKEGWDKNKDGQLDTFFYYDPQGNIVKAEYDTNFDTLPDVMEEFVNELQTKSYRDDNYDGTMDQSWVTYFNDQGRPSYKEIDLNNDGFVDSKIDANTGARHNLVHGHWYLDALEGDQHGIIVRDKRLPIRFVDKEWLVVTDLASSEEVAVEQESAPEDGANA